MDYVDLKDLLVEVGVVGPDWDPADADPRCDIAGLCAALKDVYETGSL